LLCFSSLLFFSSITAGSDKRMVLWAGDLGVSRTRSWCF
jgi:hypothetical protein